MLGVVLQSWKGCKVIAVMRIMHVNTVLISSAQVAIKVCSSCAVERESTESFHKTIEENSYKIASKRKCCENFDTMLETLLCPYSLQSLTQRAPCISYTGIVSMAH